MKGISIFISTILLVISARAQDPLCVGLPANDEELFPSPLSCNEYYKCFQGVFSIERCPTDQYFSAYNNGCVTNEYAECLGGSGSPPQTTTPVVIINPLCEGFPFNDEVVFESPLNCNQYYKCYHGEFTVERCPDGQYFSTNNQACVDPEFAECVGGSGNPHNGDDPSESTDATTTSIPTVETEVPSTTEEAITTTEAATEVPTTILPDTTPEAEATTKQDGSVVDPRCYKVNLAYWSDPGLCHTYIECYEGQSYEMSCPPNLYFSEKQKKCVDKSESECCLSNQALCVLN